jgi:DNA-binding SARP family transcriptional activator/tetratricopeptide (TPR) repeat protein
MLAPTANTIRIFLLGRFEIVRANKRLRAADWPRRKATALLHRLALERRLVKDQAIDFLWPDADLASGANNLYRTLHALRQTLDTLGSNTADQTFAFEDGVLALRDSVWVDAQAFEQTAKAALHPLNAEDLQKALDLYRGDLLPDDPYTPWIQERREILRRLHREARLALAAHYRDSEEYSNVISLLTPLAESDRADDSAARELMRAFALLGRRHEALRQYQACAEAIAVEFNAKPEPETEALYHQILNGELPPVLAPARLEDAISQTGDSGPPLIGREAESESLRLWFREAWASRGKTILIAGDSGVGKTRLALETLCTAYGSGLITLHGAAYEQEGQLVYQPFVEAINHYLAENKRSAEENPIAHFKRLGSSDPQQEHWALFDATANFLTRLASQAPAVLFVDDLHAADETSLRLFHFLARHTRSAPIVLLAAYRSDLLPSPPFATLLSSLYREQLSETLALAPLGLGSVAQLLAEALGAEAAPELVKAVFDITEGNPFFVQEIVRALTKSDQIEQAEGRWQLRERTDLQLPADLLGLIRERVKRLGSGVESALVAGAVVGREFSFEVLRHMAEHPDHELIDALDSALNNHLIEETGAGYRFRHSLIRHSLYESTSRARRRWLHGRAGEAFEAAYAQRAGGLGPHFEALAHHYGLSDRRERAMPYLIEAGQKAANVFAFEVAVDYFERALALMDAFAMQDSARHWQVLESLGWWHTTLADTPQAVKRFEQAASLPADARWQPRRRDRARVHRGAVMALVTSGDIAGAESHLRSALAEVDEHEDAAEYAHVLYNAAQVHWHRGEFPQAFTAAQHSLGVAERLNDSVAIARAFEMLALACHSLGEWQNGLRFEQQRATLAGSGLDVTEAFDVHL